MHEVIVLFDGYSKQLESSGKTDANCSCTLVKGPVNVIVDTMTAWDRDRILSALAEHKVKPDDINYVICTHSHPDHIGNNNLFTNAVHIVGCCIHKETIFDELSIKNLGEYHIHDDIKIIATPGHTLEDVTVVVISIINNHKAVIAITGDLFENENDIDNPAIWKLLGITQLEEEQAKNRLRVILMADYIIPGHGSMFEVTDKMRETIKSQVQG
ncbi:metallo-beta-lactamase domain-containing protein 1 [Chelonus insularis]|uniref:metallo-beta-lactamase domain-containing protein 1 n=1 Tax=Chelonus insularis TaxID=460826 RepID=UPI00158DB2E7|nr:metallo-beta-lactamase domain-containing protein 1 [Chelonus insularis]